MKKKFIAIFLTVALLATIAGWATLTTIAKTYIGKDGYRIYEITDWPGMTVGETVIKNLKLPTSGFLVAITSYAGVSSGHKIIFVDDTITSFDGDVYNSTGFLPSGTAGYGSSNGWTFTLARDGENKFNYPVDIGIPLGTNDGNFSVVVLNGLSAIPEDQFKIKILIRESKWKGPNL